MSVHFDMKFVMITPEGDEKVRYHKNLLQDIPVLNVIPRIITEFYEGLGETILASTIQSNLIFGHIKKVTIRIVNKDRKTGGDYIELCDGVRKSNSTINIKNFDNRCLEYCIIASREYKNVSVNGKSNPKVYQKYFKNLIIPENQQYPINLEEFIDIKKE